jgi:hypothetical protein
LEADNQVFKELIFLLEHPVTQHQIKSTAIFCLNNSRENKLCKLQGFFDKRNTISKVVLYNGQEGE